MAVAPGDAPDEGVPVAEGCPPGDVAVVQDASRSSPASSANGRVDWALRTIRPPGLRGGTTLDPRARPGITPAGVDRPDDPGRSG